MCQTDHPRQGIVSLEDTIAPKQRGTRFAPELGKILSQRITDMVRMLAASMGMDQLTTHGLMQLHFGVVLFCVLFGWFANTLSKTLSLGVMANAVVVYTSLWAGLVLYTLRIKAVRFEDPLFISLLAIASATAGLGVALTLRGTLLRRR